MATVTGMTAEAIQAELAEALVDAEFDADTGVATATKRNGEVISIGEAPTISVIMDAVYPIGSIYMSASAVNPAASLGIGTWTAWGSGRVPVGVDAAQTEFNTVEETGGSKTHTLSAAEMPKHTHTGPSHSHTMDHDHPSVATDSAGVHDHSAPHNDVDGSSFARYRTASATGASTPDSSLLSDDGAHTHNVDVPAYTGSTGSSGTGATGSAGGDGAGATTPHNNLQPYITCHMWKRVS